MKVVLQILCAICGNLLDAMQTDLDKYDQATLQSKHDFCPRCGSPQKKVRVERVRDVQGNAH